MHEVQTLPHASAIVALAFPNSSPWSCHLLIRDLEPARVLTSDCLSLNYVWVKYQNTQLEIDIHVPLKRSLTTQKLR